MNYVEWLRVRNCVRVTAIILGVLIFLAIVLRISLARYMSPEEWVRHVSLDPGSTETHVTLPDGTKRTIIDDPSERTRVVMDDHGNAGTHIVITEPTSHARHEHDRIMLGSISVNESSRGRVTTTVVDTNGAVPMLYYMGLADFFALIVATILAAPLAREVNGHLEFALTKPISRARYALAAIGADVAGILVVSVMTVLAFYCCQLMFGTWRLDLSGVNTRAIVMGAACPLAWYATVLVASTWASRGYLAAMLLTPLVAILAAIFAAVHPDNVVALLLHDIGTAINHLDPLAYVSFAGFSDHGEIDTADPTFGFRLGMQVVFFVAYSALALWRWQTVEA